MFEVKNSDDYTIIKELFSEYSQIKGTEGCFVSFDKEFTTKPNVMQTAYKLYKRMGFEEIRCDVGIVSMRIDLLKLEA